MKSILLILIGAFAFQSFAEKSNCQSPFSNNNDPTSEKEQEVYTGYVPYGMTATVLPSDPAKRNLYFEMKQVQKQGANTLFMACGKVTCVAMAVGIVAGAMVGGAAGGATGSIVEAVGGAGAGAFVGGVIGAFGGVGGAVGSFVGASTKGAVKKAIAGTLAGAVGGSLASLGMLDGGLTEAFTLSVITGSITGAVGSFTVSNTIKPVQEELKALGEEYEALETAEVAVAR